MGDPAAPATEALRRAVYGKSLPNKIVRRLAPEAVLQADHPGRRQRAGRRQARTLRLPQHDPQAPVTNPEALRL